MGWGLGVRVRVGFGVRGRGRGVAAPLLKASSKLALNPPSSPSRLGVVCAW